jgi:acyl carrier protein
MPDPAPQAQTLERNRKLLRANLKLPPDAAIADDMPLVGGDLDLDSLDILLLVTGIEKEFAVKIATETVGREAFRTVTTLARFVDRHAAGKGA